MCLLRYGHADVLEIYALLEIVLFMITMLLIFKIYFIVISVISLIA